MHCPITRALLGLAATAVALAPAAAAAQSGMVYVLAEAPAPYAALAPAEGSTLFTESDDGFVELDFSGLATPFSFRYFSRTYRRVWVSVNGGITFQGQDAVTQQVYPLPGVNVALPSSGTPNAVLAALWDDWRATALAPGGGSRVAWALVGTAPNRRLVVDWQRVQLFQATGPTAPTYSFQLHLHERTGQWEVRLGPSANDAGGSRLSATGAAENHGATAAVTHFPCSPSCGAADFTTLPDRLVSPNQNPELSLSLRLQGAVAGRPRVAVTLKNNGQSAATGVGYELYLSADPVLDDADQLIYVPAAPVDLGILTADGDESTVVQVVDLDLPAALEGRFFVVGEVDPQGAVVELDRSNNVAATSASFLAGAELSVAIAGQASGTVGENVTFTLTLRNQGVRPVPEVGVRLLATSTLLEAPVELLLAGPYAVGSEQILTVPVQVTLPRAFFPGTYSVAATIDPADAVDEVDETDNEAPVPVTLEVRGPDLGISMVTAGSRIAYQGLTVPIRVTLANRGIARAENFRFSLYLSDNDVITLRDVKVFTSSALTLEGNTQRVVTESALIPANTPVGTYYIGIIVDAEGAILEADRANNVRRSEELLTVTAAVPDLSATSLSVTPRVAAGEYASASALVANVGADLATDVPYAFYLSPNESVSTSDLKLAEGFVTLEIGAQRVVTADLLVPSYLAPGTFTLGLLVDPEHAVTEANEEDNAAVAPGALEVLAPAIAVTTPALPDAMSGVGYEVHLAARGGDGSYGWSLVGGALPEGLGFSAEGVFSGTPRTQGLYAVVVRVASAGSSADRAFTLAVRAQAASLGLLDTRLPPARLGTLYSQRIGATGGNPPYRFQLAEGAMPAGLALSPEGIVSGLPTEVGDATMAVLVEDNAGHRATAGVALDVLAATGALVFLPQRLAEPEAGRAYANGRLNVAGGTPPYAAALLAGRAPDGLALAVDDSGQEVSLVGTPTRPGVFGFTVVVSDSLGERAMSHLVLRVNSRRLTFVTAVLPGAARGQSYRIGLESNARPPATYTLVGGDLPPGLTLDAAGVIAGDVQVTAPRRLYAFAVQVTDPLGGEALAPFSIDVAAPRQQEPSTDGCASSGASGLLPLGLALLLLLGRRRLAWSGARPVVVGALAAAFVALAAAPASAFYRVTRAGETYVELADGNPIFEAQDGAPEQRGVSVPFNFRFYGAQQANVSVSPAGYVVFGAAASSPANTALPAPGGSLPLIAPFWDDLRLSRHTSGGPSLVSSKVTGTTPNREFVIEWRNLQRNATGESGAAWGSYSFQIRLYETSNDISIHYGGAGATSGQAPTLTASMGMQSGAGDAGIELSDANCSPSCTAANFPVNTRLRLRLAPDLAISAVHSPASIFAGTTNSFRATVTNTGGVAATNVRLRYLLSTDTLVDSTDTLLGEASTLEVRPATPNVVSSTFTAPTDLAPGRYELLVRVDPDDAIPEVDEEDNDAVATPIGLAPRAADFVVTRLLGGTSAQPGQPYLLTRSIKNQGNDSGSFTWKIVLSSNDFASAADTELASGAGTLAPNAVLDETDEIVIPATVGPGSYWVGLLVRPDAGVADLNPLNNDRTQGPLAVRDGLLGIGTTSLPEVVAGVPFSIQLVGEGGTGDYKWSQGFPTLPAGVALAQSGALAGVVDAAGEYRFQVQCLSGGSIASSVLTLVAVGQSTPLSVVSRRMRLGVIGTPYTAYVAAQGGVPPYSWKLAAGSGLPAGLGLSNDGAVEGVPLVDGEHSFSVEVADAAGATASGELLLPLAGPARPLLATLDLPAARYGEAYSARLVAAGGTAPYSFAVVESRRIPTGPLDTCDAVLNDCAHDSAPPGLELAADGTLSGTPARVGIYAVTVTVTDGGSFTDTASYLLAVTSASTLAIRTGTLPDAVARTDYSAALVAEGAVGEVVWSAVLLEGAILPAGLNVTAEGRVVGFPSVAGTTSFLAVVHDQSGRVAAKPIGIRVVEPPLPPVKTGCAQTGVSGVVALLFAAGLLARRRRPTPGALARGGGLLVLLGVVAMTAGCRVERPPCAEECASPLACDPLDGLCKCGGQGGAICGVGQSCDAESRACLVARCDESCAPPLACGADGRCRCGSPSGPVCAPGVESCSPLGRCERREPCAGVVCAAGMTCEAVTGACRCGFEGGTCTDGQRCVDGQCLTTRCAGVACTGGTSCDPSDGRCRCGGEGGAICVNGESCDTVNARCLRAGRCEGVVCGAGASCDPSDGQCVCGGPGGARCRSDQSCDPAARRCIGGDLCSGLTCGAGFDCDPEDGLCKCGGLGGEVCEPGQSCVTVDARSSCRTPCDPFGAPCGSGLACRYDERSLETYCVPAGSATGEAECDGETLCADGLHCRAEAGRGICRPYCLSIDTCDPDETCRAFVAADVLGVCLPLLD